MAHLDIDLLRTFVAIAENRTLGRAGDKIGRTQAAVSLQVKRLEGLVGQPLLNRTGRGVEPTLCGQRLLEHARTILLAHDAAWSELTGAGLSGTLRFGCPDDYALAFLPHILRSFAQRHPLVHLDVLCAPTPRLEEQLKAHGLDLALVSTGDTQAGSPGAPPMRREPFVWVSEQSALALARNPLQLALSDPDTLDYQAACAGLDAMGRPYRVTYASGSISGLLGVVRSGQAIAVLTQASVPDDLRILPAGDRLPQLPMVGVTVKFGRQRASALADEFARHVKSILTTL